MAEPSVLILGGGIGGVTAARELRKRLPSGARITVIDKEARAAFPPSFLWLMTGDRKPEAISRPRSRLSQAGIEFVNAEVRQIDLAERYVRADSREFHYDYLIIALGADTTMEGIPGLAESAHSFYTLEAAERLGANLRYFSGGRIAIVISSLPFKCPPAPYEAAMLLEHHFHSRRMRQKVEIDVYTPESLPMAVAGPEIGEAVLGLLAHKGIGYHGGHTLASVDTAARELRFENGETAPFQLLIAVPQHKAPAVLLEAGLCGDSGWVEVNLNTFETGHTNVFAIGDATLIPLPDGLTLPKAGVFAESMAKTVCAVIAHRTGRGPAPAPFDGAGRCFLEVGGGAAGLAEGNFFATPREIAMKQPSIVWHLAKVAFERYWLWRMY